MKRTQLKQIGKIGRINQKANREIAKLWVEHGIDFCEVCPVLHGMDLLGWQCGQASSNAHRKSRRYYRLHPNMLYSINQVVRACQMAHTFIDEHTSIREDVFVELRGKDEML